MLIYIVKIVALFAEKKNQILGCFWKKNVINKMTKKYHTVGTVPKYNRETVETNV